MTVAANPHAELARLKKALEAVSDDLDAIEQRSHWSLRSAAEQLSGNPPKDLDTFVSHFAFAVRQAG